MTEKNNDIQDPNAGLINEDVLLKDGVLGDAKPPVNLYVFVNGQPFDKDGHVATVLSDRGDFLLDHIVEKVSDAPHFMGIGSNIHHDIYKEYAPEGYVLVWVAEPLTAPDVQAAYALHNAKSSTTEVVH